MGICGSVTHGPTKVDPYNIGTCKNRDLERLFWQQIVWCFWGFDQTELHKADPRYGFMLLLGSTLEKLIPRGRYCSPAADDSDQPVMQAGV